MGQMYLPTFFDMDADIGARDWEPLDFQLCPLDFGCGFNLMEHSYVKNKLVQAVEYMLAKDEDGVRFVWAGEYAENFPGLLVNLFTWGANDKLYRKGIGELVSYDAVLGKPSFGNMCYYIKKPKTYKWVINHTKKMYVAIPKAKMRDHVIHPLPILTAESNGFVFSDYFGENKEMAGIWKYDRISVGNNVPKGYTELKVNFK